MGKAHTTHDEKFKNIVKRSRIAHARLHYGSDITSTERFGMEHTFTGFHPKAVALYSVYLPVMSQHSERLSQ